MKYGKCDDCYFYVEKFADHEVIGVCKRYPPKVVPIGTLSFPVTYPESFCGEFHPFHPEEKA